MKYESVLASTCLSLLALNPAKGIEQKECSIEFKINSSVVLQNKHDLDACFDKLNQKDIQAVTIIGSASESGTSKRNKELAHERALTVYRIIKAKFPEAIVKNINVGANEKIGKKAYVHFVLTDVNEVKKDTVDISNNKEIEDRIELLEQKNTLLEKELEKKEQMALIDRAKEEQIADNQKKNENKIFNPFSEENPNLRAAVRLGVDQVKTPERINYPSVGVELSWLNRDSIVRPEVGVKASTSIEGVQIDGKSVNRVSNAYGFAGVGATALGLVGGVRLLVGGEWIDISKNIANQDHFALGGEGRIGYEWGKGVSFFASYGLTEHLQMVGIDLGISI